MKVCIVSLNIVPFFSGDRSKFYGGAEVQAVFVAEALKACGQQVSLVVSDLPEPELIPFPTFNAFDSAAGIRGLRFFHPRWSGIAKALQQADADLYYQRNAGMLTGLVGSFCKRNGRVFVYGAGSDVDFSPRDVAIQSMRDKILYNYGLNAANGFVVQNEYQRAAAQSRFNKPVRLISNGVRGDAATHNGDGDIIVWVGAMWKVKQPGLFLELASRMPEQKFCFIGRGGELAAEVEAAASQHPNVRMLGRLSNAEVSEVLRRTAVLVNTSSVEGFPNAFLEAWSHGVPVASLNDVDDIIRTEQVGVVCSDIDTMASALRSLLADRAQYRATSERAVALVRKRFSSAVLGPRYVEFFEELMRSSRPSRVETVART
jgi:glycosyltransferase involved in cell wall biosynthesis